jgi:hypothetical protein
MGKYEALAATALALIARKGALVTFTRKNTGPVNPITDVESPAATITGTFQVVGLPPGRSAESRVGSLIGRKLMEFHIARKGALMEPSPGDTVEWGSTTWTLFWTQTYDPAADGAIYTLAYGEG